jgi:hypothetical protein
MIKRKQPSLLILLILQAVAVTLYPPSFFSVAPQAIVLPPSLLILFGLSLLALYTGALDPNGERNFLIFIQGVNLVVRLMMLFPSLLDAQGQWNFLLLITQLSGIGLSWYTMTAMEKIRLSKLRRLQRTAE